METPHYVYLIIPSLNTLEYTFNNYNNVSYHEDWINFKTLFFSGLSYEMKLLGKLFVKTNWNLDITPLFH